ncbi:hypothetical protein OB955_16735 [Halobacteria archaeon AArc-m2/3/4]|uniref:Uncharacterized protein n=1 Tax=Natronoglomus mannanivorans TaxID=2979990 RepID=A0ABT2QHG4_9EURY|nr:hypothetical protein [Halobacteria archaeon AArc-m2/3/4]
MTIQFVFLEAFSAVAVFTLESLLEYCLSWDGEWYRVQKTGA